MVKWILVKWGIRKSLNSESVISRVVFGFSGLDVSVQFDDRCFYLFYLTMAIPSSVAISPAFDRTGILRRREPKQY
jgi:hypothetical protein